MQLVNFSVTNFRSITSAKKISIRESTVLVGKNNEGKSNILKALNIAMSALQVHAGNRERSSRFFTRRNDEENYVWERDFPIRLQGRRQGTRTILRLEFKLSESEVAQFRDEIKSNLNGSLPILIEFGKDAKPQIKVSKHGPGSKYLNQRSIKIAEFIGSRIVFNYIPAVRTDFEAMSVVNKMLSQHLKLLERDPEYQEALRTIKTMQEPVLKKLGELIKQPLSEFLPNIRSVNIEIPENMQKSSLRSDFEIVIDDGTPTNLAFKGDGVKSLSALALLKDKVSTDGVSIIAIEEPESHLHPAAIHQLNEVISSLGGDNQVILTTHNPLFVDRDNMSSNIIIEDGKATAAKHVRQVREVLGVRASDNLMHANHVLVVEGETDKKIVASILRQLSQKIRREFLARNLIIQSIGGSGNLCHTLQFLDSSICKYHVLVDDDGAGRDAVKAAKERSLATTKNTILTTCKGLNEAELEDCLNPNIYIDEVFDTHGVDLNCKEFKNNKKKWSQRMKDSFQDQGRSWDKETEKSVKFIVSKKVEENPGGSVLKEKSGIFFALASAVENSLSEQNQ